MMTNNIKILLLLQLTSSVPAAAFVVNVTQSCYQAEEKHNITLEWTFTTKPVTSSTYLSIYCDLRTDGGFEPLFYVMDGVEVSLTQNDQFSGRVQSDKDALREGRIRLHVSRLRTEDSGWFRCQVNTDYGWSSASCQLNITAVELQRQTPTVTADSQERSRLSAGVTAAFAALMTVCVILLLLKRKVQTSGCDPEENQPHSFITAQPKIQHDTDSVSGLKLVQTN